MAKISAGSYDLNRWLHGGYENDIITVIYGGSGTGKTNFSIIVAVSQAKKGNKVLFIDSEGGFSVERVKQLAPENYQEVLKNIFLLKPINFEEQRDIFKRINNYLKDEVSLIILDGATILYRSDFSLAREKSREEMFKISGELAGQMQTLAEISRKKNIPVIVTNQVYTWEDSKKMVGGDILHYWGKCLIELENNKGMRTAHLRKHRSLPEKSLDFQIFDSGIKKRGWFK
ncbi:MAG: DNA repair and recombination protein RadB [Nanoarchaeota archaeon]|nr:DNA repair and recombination protein RadB [Nanoarchaeota archaeon]